MPSDVLKKYGSALNPKRPNVTRICSITKPSQLCPTHGWHAATVFEDYCRARHAAASRYWEAGAEFDFLRQEGTQIIVSEVKFKALTVQEREGLKNQVAAKWQASHLGRKHPAATVEILDTSVLAGD